MARTEQEVRDHYLELAPGYMSEPGELLDAQIRAVAAILAAVESAVDTLHDRTFIATADGSWLDQHGDERGIHRLQDESDTDYRVRLTTIEDKLTIPAIVNAINAILVTGVATLEEHTLDGCWMIRTGSPNPEGFFGCRMYRSERAFSIYIDVQFSTTSDTAFLVRTGAVAELESAFMTRTGSVFEAAAFLDGDALAPSDIYAQIIETIERLRGAGISFRVVVG